LKLVIDPEKCSGCRLCETACTYAHYGNYGSRTSRVRVVKLETQGIDYPVICQRCQNAPCVRACPTGALTQDKANGVIRVDEELCVGCGSCVKACPFGACNLHPEDLIPIMCDLCGGSPSCAEACPTGAIVFEEEEDRTQELRELERLAQAKRDAFAQRMSRAMLEKWGRR